ncbi:hypothetical protein AeMF1_018118 [Aphanomyces euteiches]|nr:hypothetical protein AeMF1_018118 [Aphanomyces euteiches]KAH9190442.1 hypothetical protein AeNC1_007583 [Aphanomyces euteiches]
MLRQRITIADKIKIKEEHPRHPEKTHEELSKWAKDEFKLSKCLDRSTISKILKYEVREHVNLSCKSYIGCKFPVMEQELYQWIKVWEDLKIPIVDGNMILEKGMQLLQQHNVQSSLSNGWLDRFKKRYNIKSRRLYGRAQLIIETRNFEKRDIFNMDETAYFYCTTPSKSMTTKAFKGRKSSKKRITVAITSNTDGCAKPPLLFVGATNQPRCFQGARPDELGLQYASAKKGWMTRTVFGNWVQNFNAEMAAENRHVLLLLDNASSHQYEGDLSNTSIVMLPPNTTSHLQPQDAGVVRSFKAKISKLKAQSTIQKAENLLATVGKENMTQSHVKKLFEVDLVEAMRWAQTAWNEVTPSTIANCWRHTAILDEDLYELNTSMNRMDM